MEREGLHPVKDAEEIQQIKTQFLAENAMSILSYQESVQEENRLSKAIETAEGEELEALEEELEFFSEHNWSVGVDLKLTLKTMLEEDHNLKTEWSPQEEEIREEDKKLLEEKGLLSSHYIALEIFNGITQVATDRQAALDGKGAHDVEDIVAGAAPRIEGVRERN